jgi:hypothetical protein
MLNLNSFENICNVYVTIYNICNSQAGTAMGLGFMKHYTLKRHFTCSDDATSSNIYILNSVNLLIYVNIN